MELEKVSNVRIGLSEQLSSRDLTSTMSDICIAVGMFGLICETNANDLNPAITTYLLGVIMYGIMISGLGRQKAEDLPQISSRKAFVHPDF